MKDADNHTASIQDENEISVRIKEVAVKHGLQLPQTQEEVVLFEQCFAHEIYSAGQNPPSLKDILALADRISTSSEPVVVASDNREVDSRYAMAARNGKEISPETQERMEDALRKVKSEHDD